MSDPAVVAELLDTRMRVVTWNIWWRFGPWEKRLPLIIDELRRLDPDVVALQEVWATTETSAADEIGRALGFESVFAGHLELEPGVRFGNAVVSRWPIAGHDTRPLPAGAKDDEQRLVLRVDVDGPRGALQVFSTHLNWRFDQSGVRQEQVRVLARFVADSRPRGYPAVVCGDLNAEPHSVEVEMLTGQRDVAVDGLVLVDTWRVANPDDVGFTWDNRNPFVAAQLEWNRRIDYVLVGWPKQRGAGNAVAAELVGTTPRADVWPSDHFGVAADLRY